MKRAAMLSVALLVGCGARARDPAREPMEFLLPQGVDTMDPRDAVDAYSHRTTRLLHAGLTRLDPVTVEPRPDVARAWHWDNDRTLVFELDTSRMFRLAKRAVRGSDVCATIDAFRSSRQRHVVEVVERCEATDASVTLHVRAPHPSLVAGLELPVLREDQAHDPPRPDGSLDGLGAFAVVHATHADIELAPTSDSNARHVVLRAVQDETSRAMRLLAGRADVVQNGLALGLADEIAKDHRIRLRAIDAANLTYIVLNNESPAFRAEERRRAFAAAIPRAELASAFFGDRARVATSLLPPTHWAFRETSCGRPLEPAKDVAFEAPIRLLVSTDRFRRTIGRTIEQRLGDHGIPVDVVSVELGTMLSRLGAGDFDAALLQLPEIADPDVFRVFLHGANVPPAGSNRGRVRDAAVDALFDRAGEALDIAQRADLYANAFSLICDHAYFVPLWHERHVVLTSDRAARYAPSADGRWSALAALATFDP